MENQWMTRTVGASGKFFYCWIFHFYVFHNILDLMVKIFHILIVKIIEFLKIFHLNWLEMLVLVCCPPAGGLGGGCRSSQSLTDLAGTNTLPLLIRK